MRMRTLGSTWSAQTQRVARTVFVVSTLTVLGFSGLAVAAHGPRPTSTKRHPSRSAAHPRATKHDRPSWQSPDPKPVRSKHRLIITVNYRNGHVSIRRVRRVELNKPRATARMMGRFAFELLRGPVVVERLRFNFPLLGDSGPVPSRRRLGSPPRFDRHISTQVTVALPVCPKANRARIVDRATGRIWNIPWPPKPRPSKNAIERAKKPSPNDHPVRPSHPHPTNDQHDQQSNDR